MPAEYFIIRFKDSIFMVAFTAIGVGLFAKVGKILLMGKILSAEILAKQNNFDEFKTSSEQ